MTGVTASDVDGYHNTRRGVVYAFKICACDPLGFAIARPFWAENIKKV
jgi:hypothetical protein